MHTHVHMAASRGGTEREREGGRILSRLHTQRERDAGLDPTALGS